MNISEARIKELRWKRIVELLTQQRMPLKIDHICECRATSPEELERMQAAGLITYIPDGKYTAFDKRLYKKAKRA